MALEEEHHSIPLSSIHIDLEERSVTFTAADQTGTKLSLTPSGILYQLIGGTAVTERSVTRLIGEMETQLVEADRGKEKEPTSVVAGRLKSTPKQGEPDRAGHPTAWARLAAHEEGRADAHMYSCTFHRHTAKIALTLQAGAQVTVEGYPHPANREGRMDTLSVINILRYPGQPGKGASQD